MKCKVSFRNGVWLLLAALLLLTVDILSKAVVFKEIPTMVSSSPFYPYGGIGVFRDVLGVEFSLVHMHNTGAAWGLFKEFPNILVALRITLIIGLLIYLFFRNGRKGYQWLLLLIITGAIGNIIDYFTYGYVVDMFHVVLWGWDYPVFNVADSAICVGVIGWFIWSVFEKEKSEVV